jgi:hypothetical protein
MDSGVRADIYCRVLMKHERLPCIYRILSPIFLCSYVEFIVTELLIILRSILGWTGTVELGYSVKMGAEYIDTSANEWPC